MNYLLTDELAKKWGVSPTRIRVMAKAGQIPGAKLIGNTWVFLADTEKPLDRRSKAGKAEPSHAPFIFPLYLLKRIDESSLNDEQRQYIQCERLLYDLKFEESYAGFHEILDTSSDTTLRAGVYYYLCQISGMLGKYDESFLHCRKLSALLSRDIPHQKELALLLWELRLYTHDQSFEVPQWENAHEYHPSCGPEMIMIETYLALINTFKTDSSIDPSIYEVYALILNGDDFPLANVYLHLILGTMWSLNKNLEMKQKHLRLALDIALKHHFYYAVMTYLNNFGDVLSEIIKDYPEDALEEMMKANRQYTFTNQEICERATKSSVPFITQEEHAYMLYLIEGFTSAQVAKAKGISEKTVYKHYLELRDKFGAKNKKELLEEYRRFMVS